MIIKRDSSVKIQIVTYVLITYALTWIIWGVIYFFSNSFFAINTADGSQTIFINNLIPSIVGIILTGYFDGFDGIKGLFKRFTIWKVNPFFYIFVLFYALASYCVPFWICNTIGYKCCLKAPAFFRAPLGFCLILFTLIYWTVIRGALREELGWRGFLLKKLQSKLSPVCSSLIVGTLWACWYIPSFFLNKNPYDVESFGLFFISTITLSIILTWIYNRTHGSLLFTSIFYGAYGTTVAELVSYGRNDFMVRINKYTVIFVAFQVVLISIIIFDMIRNYKKQPINFNKQSEL